MVGTFFSTIVEISVLMLVQISLTLLLAEKDWRNLDLKLRVSFISWISFILEKGEFSFKEKGGKSVRK